MRISPSLSIPLSLLFVTGLAAGAAKKKPAEALVDPIGSPTYVQPETARLVAPKDAVSTRAVKVLLVTVVPASSACYEPSAEVDHVDRFTHVISARARAFLEGTCAKRRSRYDFQTLDLGLLQPGTHTIRVEDTVTPLTPLTLVVRDGAVAVAPATTPPAR